MAVGVEHEIGSCAAERVSFTLIDKLLALFLIVYHVLLLYHLTFLIEEVLLKVLHESDILHAIVSSILHWVSLLIHLDSLTALILDALLFNCFPEQHCKLILILLDPPLHA